MLGASSEIYDLSIAYSWYILHKFGINKNYTLTLGARIAQSVWRLATVWTIEGSEFNYR
jgi:hypothetical protein